MGILRTYFSKDNVIVRDSTVNTGRNPIVELFYGGSTNINDTTYSRYLFSIDFSQLKTIMKTPILIDGRNIYEKKNVKAFGISYFSIGKNNNF